MKKYETGKGAKMIFSDFRFIDWYDGGVTGLYAFFN
jgi:hypothetical protein